MFEPITKNIFRWGTNDPESGVMMYSHLLLHEDKAVLIDPVSVPDLAKMVKVLGEPIAVIMTNYPHLRGCPYISKNLNIPLYIPEVKAVEEDEKLVNVFLDLFDVKNPIQYNESTELPFGIKAYIITGRREMALKFQNFLIVGDSAYGINRMLSFFPKGIREDDYGIKSKATADALIPIIKKTASTGLLSGHMEDIPSGLQNMV